MPSACACTDCALHETAVTVCMAPDTPNDKPTFAVVGEAPGAEEDRQGLPFVGPSGQLLWDELARHGLTRESAHVTNVVKCRPPDNRTPKQGEIKRCLPYLQAELEYLRDMGCKYILALGATAYKALGGQGSITDHAGTPYEWQGFTIVPSLHPAAALRSPQQMTRFKQAVGRFAQVVRGKRVTLPDVEVVVVRDEQGIKSMYQDLQHHRVVAFDIETYGLDEQQEHSDIICISYCAKPEKAYVVLLNHPERTGDRQEMEKLLRQVHGLPVVWVAHNGKFDCRWLDRFGLVAPKLKADTIIMAHLLDETSPKNVEAVASRYLGIPTWKHLMADHFKAIADAIQKGYAIPAPPLEDLARYAALDAAIERMLFDELRRRMAPQQRRLHGFLVRVSRVLQGVEQVGVPVSRDELERAMEHSRKEMRRATLRAAKLLKKEPSEVKLSSPQWLAQILFGELQLPVVEFTGGGAPTTSEYSLKRVKQYSPKLIQAILDYRKHQKYIGSYLEPWSRKLTPDGRLRSSYNITGTVTGRLACTNVQTFPREKMGMSLHQVPRDGEIRSVVTAPPGRKLVVADYSQIELRVAAALANEKRMILAYQRGEDIHTLTAATITGNPLDQVTKEDRQRAKSVNFGFLYGMGARNFVRYAFEQYDLEFTLEEAQQVRNRFFSLYPGLVAWHREVEDFVLRHGYVVSPLGRVRHLPDVHSQDKYLRSEAVRQAINSPVQATASDFTLAAMVLVDKALKERPDLEAVVIGQVHDSILLECSDQHAMAAAELVKRTMEEETPAYVERQFGYRFPIPLAAEVSIGSSWGKYEKVLA